MFSARPRTRRGQALVIILLVLAVSSTVVLSLVTRTVTDITITNKEKESSRAFSASEAGIEEALIGGPTSGSLPGGETYSVTSGVLGEGAADFAWPEGIKAGDTVPIWFVSHASDGSLTCSDGKCFTGSSAKVCWGTEGIQSGDAQTPAVEVLILYLQTPGNYATARVARAAIDPNATRRGSNKFDAPDGGGCSAGGKTFAFGKTLNFTDYGIPASVYSVANGLQTARIRLIYNTTAMQPVGVAAGGTFPGQGTRFSSVGSSGDATRKIEVFRSFSDLPPIFDFAIFSPSSLVK